MDESTLAGIIVGSVFGALLLVCICVMLYRYVRPRRSQHLPSKEGSSVPRLGLSRLIAAASGEHVEAPLHRRRWTAEGIPIDPSEQADGDFDPIGPASKELAVHEGSGTGTCTAATEQPSTEKAARPARSVRQLTWSDETEPAVANGNGEDPLGSMRKRLDAEQPAVRSSTRKSSLKASSPEPRRFSGAELVGTPASADPAAPTTPNGSGGVAAPPVLPDISELGGDALSRLVSQASADEAAGAVEEATQRPPAEMEARPPALEPAPEAGAQTDSLARLLREATSPSLEALARRASLPSLPSPRRSPREQARTTPSPESRPDLELGARPDRRLSLEAIVRRASQGKAPSDSAPAGGEEDIAQIV